VILHRNQRDRFSKVWPAWAGETAILLGGGPSLTLEQVETVRQACQAARCRVITINDSYLLAPWADVLYAADPRWWGWHKDRQELAAFEGERCSIQCDGEMVAEPVHVLRNRDYPNHGSGLSLDPGALVTGRNGGFQALNLAILAGARTVILLGFDGRPSAAGRTHWHGGHKTPTPAAAYEEYRRAFSAGENAICAGGVRVLNCSPGSAIDSFAKVNLGEVLA